MKLLIMQLINIINIIKNVRIVSKDISKILIQRVRVLLINISKNISNISKSISK